jgi:hypothetical protein
MRSGWSSRGDRDSCPRQVGRSRAKPKGQDESAQAGNADRVMAQTGAHAGTAWSLPRPALAAVLLVGSLGVLARRSRVARVTDGCPLAAGAGETCIFGHFDPPLRPAVSSGRAGRAQVARVSMSVRRAVFLVTIPIASELAFRHPNELTRLAHRELAPSQRLKTSSNFCILRSCSNAARLIAPLPFWRDTKPDNSCAT